MDRFVDRRVEYPGGNCVNVAVMTARLGADSAYLGVIGDDERGRFLLGSVAAEGVDVSRVARRSGPTGLTEIETVDGDRVFLRWNEGGVTTSAPYRLGGEARPDTEYVSGFDLVHSSVYSASLDQLDTLNELGVLVSFDLSSESENRTPEYLRRLAGRVDLLLMSLAADGEDAVPELEASPHGATVQAAGDVPAGIPHLAGPTVSGTAPDSRGRRLMRAIADQGTSLVLATHGSAGAVLFDGTEYLTVAADPIPGEFKDTMGCGDAFLSGFVFELLRNGWSKGVSPSRDLLIAGLETGARNAAAQCTVDGAFGRGRTVPPPGRTCPGDAADPC